MRSVLSLAVVLMIIAVLMRVARVEPDSRTHAGPDDGLVLVAMAKGAFLPPARFPGMIETFDDLILVGDLILNSKRPRAGIRVATLSPKLEFVSYRTYDTARSESDIEAFLGACRRVPTNSVLILTTFSVTEPEPGLTGHRKEDLVALLGELGAEMTPLDGPPASWAMITVRRPSGWVKLAESFSREQGVSLVFTIRPELSTYDGHRGEVMMVQRTEPLTVRLDRELAAAQVTEDVRNRPGGTVGRVTRPVIDAMPLRVSDGPHLPSSVLWREVLIDDGVVFRTAVGLKNSSWPDSNGATFQLLVDGTVIRSESVVHQPGEPNEWSNWQVDLGAYAGKTVDIELRVDPMGDASADRALWGDPTLSQAVQSPTAR